MLAAIGAGLATGLEAAGVTSAIAIYALHHGLAKGALFLGVGAMSASAGKAADRQRAVLAIIALSVAGLPLTGGALAKLALKAPLGPVSELFITASAFTTALLLTRFLASVRPSSAGEARAPLVRSIPVAVLGAGALILPWAVWEMIGLPMSYAWQWSNLLNGALPLALAILAVWAATRTRLSLPVAPQGDLLALAYPALTGLASALRGLGGRLPSVPHLPARKALSGALLDRAEAAMTRALPAILLALVLALALLVL